MTRSPGFGSTACDYAPLSDSVSLRLPYTVKLATNSKSLTHYTKGTQSPLRAPTACTHTVSGSISLPSPGFFSPFPHGTGSLSVGQEYLALEDGPPMFRQGFSCPALLNFIVRALSHTGLSPSMADAFQRRFAKTVRNLRAAPRSLVTTEGISVDFFSSGYLDISVPRVRFAWLCIHHAIPLRGGFPHSDIAGSMLVASSPTLFAGCHVLHRL